MRSRRIRGRAVPLGKQYLAPEAADGLMWKPTWLRGYPDRIRPSELVMRARRNMDIHRAFGTHWRNDPSYNWGINGGKSETTERS